MRVDAHQHFWLLAARAGQWPPPALAAIHRDFLPADLAPLLARHAIDATVLVQSLPSEADTHWMLSVADATPFVAGVVGWTDLKAADAPARIAALAAHGKLVGLRPMLQDLPDDDWIADPALGPAIEAMQAHGLVFDALVQPRHLPALATFARRFPGLPIVIDHGAKPDIARVAWQPWCGELARLAALPNVHCKLSGLVTEAVKPGTGDWYLDQLLPWVAHVLAAFGPRRVLWGSDWPVLDLAGGYDRWVAATESLLAGLDPAARSAVVGGNACAFYKLHINA